MLKMVLEMMPPDLASDISRKWWILTGGGALIRGLDKYLSEIVRLPVYIADEPLLAVAKDDIKLKENFIIATINQ